MELFGYIATAYMFAGAILLFFSNLENFIKSRIARDSIIQFMMEMIGVLGVLNLCFIINSLYYRYPLSVFPFITLVYLYGPLHIIDLHTIISPKTSIPLRLTIHFLPPCIMCIAELIFQFQPAEYKVRFLSNLFTAPMENPFTIVILVGVADLIIYLSIVIRFIYRFQKVSDMGKPMRHVKINSYLFILMALLLVTGFILKNQVLMLTGGTLSSFRVMYAYFVNNKNPEFYKFFQRSVKKIRYEKSQLYGLNSEDIKNRLNELMMKEQIFKDFNLQLKDMADQLHISSHQLSEFLNKNLNIDFRSFINTYRVEEAKRLLTDKPDQSIISICYEVGFSTKANFNFAFKRIIGKTPSEYRNTVSGRLPEAKKLP